MKKKIVISAVEQPITIKMRKTSNSNKLVDLIEQTNSYLLSGKGVALEAILPNGKKVKVYLDGTLGDKFYIKGE